MAELADALVLGASGQPCGFNSHCPHHHLRWGTFACRFSFFLTMRPAIGFASFLFNGYSGESPRTNHTLIFVRA